MMTEQIHAKQEAELIEELETKKIKEKIQIKAPIPDLIPRLLPLEYCNLTRAAKMLNIEVDDIRHFNQVDKIALYLRKEECDEVEQWSDEYKDYIPCKFNYYKFVPYFVDEVADYGELDLQNEVYIKSTGLETLHSAIYGGEVLSELPEQEKAPTPAKIFVAPVSFIAALLELLPDLKAKIDKTPTNAPTIVDKHLIKNNLAPINLGKNNLSNWLDRSTYNPLIKVK
jgi:hypothetical protein